VRIALVVNRGKPLAARVVPPLVEWLRARGHEPLLAAATARAFGVRPRDLTAARLVRRTDLVVAFGGDGTLLRAARYVGRREVPIMGVNLGGLGFLTAFSVPEARRGIADFARGRHAEESRMVIACSHGRRRGFALNDIALGMGPSGRVIEIIARSGSDFVNKFTGDGLVVATPTGSTAYSLAAGGPVVCPTMDAILLTPLSPHALAARPLILPADASIELEIGAGSDPGALNVDGQKRWRVAAGEPIGIARAPFRVRLVVPRDRTYYQILRDKMKWSGSQV